jgi:hypothetical protein
MMRAIANGGARRAENASPSRTALMLGTRQRVFLQFAASGLVALPLSLLRHAERRQHHVIISVKRPEARAALIVKN